MLKKKHAYISIFIIAFAVIIHRNYTNEYIIPYNFKGRCVVFFEQEGGALPNNYLLTQSFELNDKGVFKTRLEFQKQGLFQRRAKYFVKDGNGVKKELIYQHYVGSDGYLPPFGLTQDSTVVYCKKVGVTILNGTNKQVRYSSFLVGAIKESNSIFKESEKVSVQDLINK